MADMAMAISQPARSSPTPRRFWVIPPLTILALLSRVEETQAELREVMTKVVRG